MAHEEAREKQSQDAEHALLSVFTVSDIFTFFLSLVQDYLECKFKHDW